MSRRVALLAAWVAVAAVGVPIGALAGVADDEDAALKVRAALRKPGVSLGPLGMDFRQAVGVAHLVMLRDLEG